MCHKDKAGEIDHGYHRGASVCEKETCGSIVSHIKPVVSSL